MQVINRPKPEKISLTDWIQVGHISETLDNWDKLQDIITDNSKEIGDQSDDS